MIEPEISGPDKIDRLLSEHLERQAEQLDVHTLHDRIRATMALERSPVAPARRGRSFAWVRWMSGIAVAASLFVGSLLFWQSGQSLRASPYALLQETQKTLLQPIYRCYLVEIEREANLTDDSNPMMAQSRQSRLWTRGDRFWIETTFPNRPERTNCWGRDEQGTIWMTDGAKDGVLIRPSETPRWLTVFSDLCSMQPDRLIVEVLRDFDLHREDAPPSSSVNIIKADLKPGRWHPGLKGAVLELDAETKVLRRVVLHRVTHGVNVTATFTLVETKNQDAVQYPLEGREGEREFYSAEYKPDERKRFLTSMFGHRVAEWMRLGKK